MTREEAIGILECVIHTEAKWPGTEDTLEAIDMAIDALRPVSREQVEKVWGGEWKFEPDIYDCGTYVCSKCGEHLKTYYCEERLYLVGCVDCGTLTLVKTTSPGAAAAAAGHAPGIAAEAPQHETTEHSTWHEWIAGRFGDVR